jgi:DMSO/TMAO reductase YedYZ molybdopterin-dependent catalytic subunit
VPLLGNIADVASGWRGGLVYGDDSRSESMCVTHAAGVFGDSYPPARPRIAAKAALAGLLAVALLSACAPPSTGGVLPGVEVRDYQGQRLDSVNDFRENSIKGPQHVDITTYLLTVDGLVSQPATYTYDQVVSREATYTKVVQIDCVEGWSVKLLWEGVLLSDLIDRARPSAEATTVVFHAADGYTTSLPLQSVRDNRILFAYKMNGITIPEERGYPFMVVAEDHWGYKWAKWVTEIELSNDPNYLGYWEQRGYSQMGLRSQNMFSRTP